MKNALIGLALWLPLVGHAATLLIGNPSGSEIESFSLTGTDLGAFVTPGSGGLADPGGFAFGPDGNLYVVSRNNYSILEYNGVTGAFIGTFATITDPADIEFGPNGNAYVESGSGFYILDGTTGAVLDDIAAEPSYGGTFLPSNGDFLLAQPGLAGTILEYTPNGTFVGTYATGVGEVLGLAVGPNGQIYASNAGTGDIEVVPLGGGAASLFYPAVAQGYIASSGGDLYTTSGNYIVFTVDSSGTLVDSFATALFSDPYGIAVQGAAVPEPASLSLAGAGLIICVLLGRLTLRRRL